MLTFTLLAAFFAADPPVAPVNAAIGDMSWIARYGNPPTVADASQHRIRVHLDHVADRLAAAPTSQLTPVQRTRRARSIAALRTYAARGVFPRRDADDGYGPRRPRFIDDRGVHCAVGELIRVSGRPDLARAIDRRWEMAYVPDMAEPALLDWADAHGFTVDELAMIQPTYGPPLHGGAVPKTVRKHIDQRLLFSCGASHAVPESLTLRVELLPRLKRRVTEVTPATSFGACAAEWLAGGRSSGFTSRLGQISPRQFRRGPDGKRVDPTLDVEVPLTPTITPALFDVRMKAIDLRAEAAECWDRDWPRLLLAELQVVSEDGKPTLKARTVPPEPAAAACFVAFARPWVMREDPPRGPADLDVRRAWSESAHLPEETLTRLARGDVCTLVDPCLARSKVAADRALYAAAAKAEVATPLRVPVDVELLVDPIAVQVEVGEVPGTSPAFRACLAEKAARVMKPSLERLHAAPSFPAIDVEARARLEVECMPGEPLTDDPKASKRRSKARR